MKPPFSTKVYSFQRYCSLQATCTSRICQEKPMSGTRGFRKQTNYRKLNRSELILRHILLRIRSPTIITPLRSRARIDEQTNPTTNGIIWLLSLMANFSAIMFLKSSLTGMETKFSLMPFSEPWAMKFLPSRRHPDFTFTRFCGINFFH